MEAEICIILTDAVTGPGEPAGLFDAILVRFGELGGAELDIPPHTEAARAWGGFPLETGVEVIDPWRSG